MKSLQEALQNQLKETSEKAEKHQATVSVFVSLCVIALGLRIYFFLFSNHNGKIHHKKKKKTKSSNRSFSHFDQRNTLPQFSIRKG